MLYNEISAGGVVLRQMRHQWWIAVIEPAKRENPKYARGIIALPKGNIEPGEKAEQAAAREVLEETGLRAEPVTKLGDISYRYVRQWSRNERVLKVVAFYLMKYQSGRIGAIATEMRCEVRRSYWVPLQEATARLSYRGDKKMAMRALQHLHLI